MSLFTPNIKKLEEEKNTRSLLKHITHRNPEIRLKAFYSLIKILNNNEILEKLRPMLKDPDPRVRTIIVLHFADIGDETVFENLKSIIVNGTLKEKTRTLRKLSDRPVSDGVRIANILVLALNDNNHLVKIQTLRTMGVYKNGLFLNHIVNSIDNKKFQVRLEAVNALGNLHMDEVLDPLIGALVDSHKEVRWAAKEAIGKINTDRARDILKNAPFMLLVKNMNESMIKKVETAEHIGKHKMKEALPLLQKACKDEYKNVRMAAVKAIGNIRAYDISAISAAAEMTKDKYFDARLEAVKALEKIFDPSALEALNRARNDENKNVRDTAERAYHNLKARIDKASE